MTFPFCKLQHCVFFLIQCSSLVFYLFPYFILVMSKKHWFPLVLILHVQKWLLFAHVNLNSFLFFLFRSLCTSVIHILHHDAFRWYSLPLRRAVLSKNRDNGSALPQRVHSLRSTPSTTTRLRGFLLTISHGPHSDAPYLLQ